MFSVWTRYVAGFENARMTVRFGFALEENLGKEITLFILSRCYLFRKALFSILECNAGVFKSLKSVFEKLRFRDGLVWTVGLTVEIILRFQIYSA